MQFHCDLECLFLSLFLSLSLAHTPPHTHHITHSPPHTPPQLLQKSLLRCLCPARVPLITLYFNKSHYSQSVSSLSPSVLRTVVWATAFNATLSPHWLRARWAHIPLLIPCPSSLFIWPWPHESYLQTSHNAPADIDKKKLKFAEHES